MGYGNSFVGKYNMKKKYINKFINTSTSSQDAIGYRV